MGHWEYQTLIHSEGPTTHMRRWVEDELDSEAIKLGNNLLLRGKGKRCQL